MPDWLIARILKAEFRSQTEEEKGEFSIAAYFVLMRWVLPRLGVQT